MIRSVKISFCKIHLSIARCAAFHCTIGLSVARCVAFRCTIGLSIARCGFPLHTAGKKGCMAECKRAPQTLPEYGETRFPGAVPLWFAHLLTALSRKMERVRAISAFHGGTPSPLARHRCRSVMPTFSASCLSGRYAPTRAGWHETRSLGR